MAVSDNQYKYLNNMAAGKTSTGGQATSGQSAWAKAQLAKVPAPPATPKPTMTPVTGSVPTPTQTTPKNPPVPTANSVPNPNTATNTVKPSTGLAPITNTGSVPTPPSNPTTFSSPQYNDWISKQNEAFANLEKLISTPFQYNPETDPGYLAQRQLSQNRAKAASNSALESMNERGIMGSSLTANQLGQIQQNAEQEALAYIPQYREQAYNQYQDRLKGAGEILAQARNLRSDQMNEAVTQSGQTGYFKSPDVSYWEQQLADFKYTTEQNWSNMTREQQLAAKAEGDRLRSILDSVGGNSSLFGADVTANNARSNMGKSGTRSMVGQIQDYAEKQGNWGAYGDIVNWTQNLGQGPQSNWGNLVTQAGTGQNTFAADQAQIGNGFTMAQLTGYLPDGTPTSAEQQQQLSNLWVVAQQTGTIPNQLADLYDLPRGSKTQDAIAQAAQIAISRQNANTSSFNASTSAYNANTSRMNANNSQLMDIWKATGQAPAGLESYGINAGTPYAVTSAKSNVGKYAEDYYDAIDKSIYLSPEMNDKGYGDPVKTGKTIVNDRNGLETYILSLNLSNDETRKLYTRYGLPLE